jgi:hypothetical protein
MPAPSNTDVLHWRSLTAATNETKGPLSFLKNYLFGNDMPMPTKNIELSVINNSGRLMAPFVKRGSAGLMTPGTSDEFRLVQPAHIRVKHPMTPTDLLDNRRAGFGLHVDAADVRRAIQGYIAREIRERMNQIDNSEEYLAAQALTGVISYESEYQVSFEITLPRDSSLDIDLSSTLEWDETTSSIRGTFQDVSELINDLTRLTVTDVFLGSEAADAFVAHAEITGDGGLLDILRLQTGNVSFMEKFNNQGALYLGSPFQGINVWRYASKITMPDGTEFDVIRPKYAEFVARTPEAEFVTYYGAIEDMDAIGNGQVLQSKRFAKSWVEPDPSARMLLIESNPLPFIRRPNATASVKVLPT